MCYTIVLFVKNLRELLGDEVPDEYIAKIINEADFKNDNRVSYDEFLEMWQREVEDGRIEAWSGISAKRTVCNLESEMLEFSGTDDDLTSGDDNDTPPPSKPRGKRRLGSIIEIREGGTRSYDSGI
jgi:hypothetical protein